MFSQACVKNSVHGRGGACMAGGCAWGCVCDRGVARAVCVARGVHGGGHAWWEACKVGGAFLAGACMAGDGGMCGGGMPPTRARYYEIWPVNEQAVRILLECILVF